MPAPTYNSSYSFTNGWGTLETTSSTTTATFTVNPDDLIVVFGGQANYDTSTGIDNIVSISDNYNLKWTLVSANQNNSFWCPLRCWCAVNTYPTSITITITLSLYLASSTTVRFGGKAYTFSNSNGIGFTANYLENSASDGSYDLAITPYGGSSLFIFYVLDWSTWDLIDRTYGTNNGLSPTEIDYSQESNYTVVAALYNNTVDGNLSFLTAQSPKVTAMAIEILGFPFGVGQGVLPPSPIGERTVYNITSISKISSIRF